MHTIEELDSPIRGFDDEPPVYPIIEATVEQQQPLLIIDDNDVLDGSSDSIEEDELLNNKYVELSIFTP